MKLRKLKSGSGGCEKKIYEILGDYNPLAWDNSTEGIYMETNDSFIFSLKNGNIQNSILSRVKDQYSDSALYYYNSKNQKKYGPRFGNCEFLLQSDFSELINDKKEYNVTIEVDKEENKKSFTSHSVVLRHRSTYFTKELENTFTNENHVKTIIKPNVSAQIFEIILKNIETKIIYELMIVANELEFEELPGELESYLVESKASWLRTHFSRIYHSIFDRNKCNEFKEEIKIWDYVIKWGIAQNLTLPTNLKEWSKENFETLKTTLQQCLPLIRYFHISEKDVWERLKPYRKILGTQLWDDLNQQFIFPNQTVKSLVLPARIISNPELPQRINESISTIINEEHVAEISSWIDRKSTIYSLTNVPYKFQLILRGSKDGFQQKTFWNMDILDNSNAKAIFMETNDSFIFSLKNGNIQNSILSRVKDQYSDSALYYYDSNRSNVNDFTKDKECLCLYDERIRNLDYVIKWGTAQNSTLPEKNAMERFLTLPDRLIKSIILPPRLVLKQELPARVIESFSAIINEEHTVMISLWINDQPTSYSSRNIPYGFQLILQKIKETDKIIGGFNPLAWDKTEKWMETK
ncbi:hypothetical protein Glove_440g16 [Diversispora epigaea]|uniref:BTB domain-containing protein n=1 Tax=Diversispora epigaea TaxID=1348612 RepID=A0A397GTN7_9GLOM|nr:hypothetical protein Glove_440g16 [Diversispora epigaea]